MGKVITHNSAESSVRLACTALALLHSCSSYGCSFDLGYVVGPRSNRHNTSSVVAGSLHRCGLGRSRRRHFRVRCLVQERVARPLHSPCRFLASWADDRRIGGTEGWDLQRASWALREIEAGHMQVGAKIAQARLGIQDDSATVRTRAAVVEAKPREACLGIQLLLDGSTNLVLSAFHMDLEHVIGMRYGHEVDPQHMGLATLHGTRREKQEAAVVVAVHDTCLAEGSQLEELARLLEGVPGRRCHGLGDEMTIQC